MLLHCKKCAYPNLPTLDVCGRCGNVIQSPAELAQSIQFWNGLPEPARQELERKYQDAQSQAKEYGFYQKSSHIKYTIVGGLILTAIGFFSGFPVADIIVGGLAGWRLYMKKGGIYRGLVLFGGGFVISLIIKAMCGLSYINYLLDQIEHGGGSYDVTVMPIVLLLCGGLLLSLCSGYVLGQKIANESFDRGL